MQICTPINGISTKSGVSELWPSAHGNWRSNPFKLTDFWNTESRGVQTNCSCEPACMSKIGKEEYDIISKSCEKVGEPVEGSLSVEEGSQSSS